jgi:signal peptidase I
MESTEPPVVIGAPAQPRLRGRRRKRQSTVGVIAEWALIIGLAISVALLVRAYVVQTFFIPTESMTPTLRVNDRLLVEKISLKTREVERSDIIVFEKPENFDDPNKKINDLVKRVIGLPGELVEGKNGRVFINGSPLEEPYLPAGVTTADFSPRKVPVDNYFVMGDNRPGSNDSRYWGTVPREKIVGRPLFRIWPVSRIGSL